MSFGNHWISGSNGRRKISARSAVVSKREIVGTEDDNRTDGSQHGTNIGRGIDDRVPPRFRPSGIRRLTQLIRRARQLSIFQTR